jgi:glycosyltransferase involved in cell wall biosynthesis
VAERLHSVDVVADNARGLDLVHSHLEGHGLALVRRLPIPVLTTLHLSLGQPGMARLLGAYRDAPLVAISDAQRREAPEANWTATIHHGLPLERMPYGRDAGDYLLLVGRATPDKGVVEALELARRSGMRLLIAAKAREPVEIACVRQVIRPAERQGIARYFGEVDSSVRDELFAGAFATLMLGDWPEPFGLVSIESLSTGTPVIARRRGALPEIVRDGVDGFVVDDVEEAVERLAAVPGLDRRAIRRGALARFSVDRMVDQYEAAYAGLLAAPMEGAGRPTEPAAARRPRHGADVAPR